VARSVAGLVGERVPLALVAELAELAERHSL